MTLLFNLTPPFFPRTFPAMSYNTFTLPAPAKITLFLHVTGMDPSGAPLVQGVTSFVSVGDELEFSKHDALFIDTEGPFADDLSLEFTSPRDNVVCKAALALAENYKIQPTGRVILRKNLPVASGIGGSPTDAATAFLGFVRLWGLPEEWDRVKKIARDMDADIPSCLVRKPMWVEGAGDKLTWLQDMPVMHFVLARPPGDAPAQEVLRNFGRGFSPPLQFQGRRKSMHEWIADLKIYRNDLTDSAIEICPAIGEVLHALSLTPNCHFARLSGTGPTCFGVYDTAVAAAAAANKLKHQHPDWWIVAADLLK